MRIKNLGNIYWPVAFLFGAAFVCFIAGQGSRNVWSWAGVGLTLLAGVPPLIAALWNGAKDYGKKKGWW